MDRPLELKDIFTWKITYNDGVSISEFNQEGRAVNTYPGAKIDLAINDFDDAADFERFKAIKAFNVFWIKDILANVDNELKVRPFVSIVIPDKGRLIWRRRSLMDQRSAIKARVFAMGWRKENNIYGEKITESILHVIIGLNSQKRVEVNLNLSDMEENIDFFEFEKFPFEKREEDKSEIRSVSENGR